MNKLLQWLERYWLALLLVIAFAVLIALSYGELRAAVSVLARSQWQWILAAIILLAIYFIVYTYEYVLGFAAVDVQSQVLQLLPVLFASIFVKSVIPSGGVSSLAVFVENASERGQSGARAAEGSLLVLVADLAGVMPLIAFGLAYLAGRGLLEVYQVLTTALYLLFTLAMTGVVLLGRWFPRELQHLLNWTTENINWIAGLVMHRSLLPEGWADQQATQYTGAARSLTEHPRIVGYILLTALAGDLINLASLVAISLAYGVWLGLDVLTTAFAMNMVFSVVTILPHGIGVAESVMVLVLAQLGVTIPVSLAITVAYRGLSVWLPIFIGFFFVRTATGGTGK